MIKYIFCQILVILIGILPVRAIDATVRRVSFSVKASVSDSVVCVGQKIHLRFEVQTKDKVSFDFEDGDVQNMKIVSGPMHSSQSSISVQGGKRVEKYSQIYTYILEASQKGSTTIPAIVFKTDSTMSFSHPIAIQINPAPKQEKQKEAEKSTVSDDEVFVDVQYNSHKIAAGDSMIINYRIYSTYDLQEILDVQEPTFKGYKGLKQPVNRLTRRQGWDIVNGRKYTTLNWYQYLIKAPNKQGEITIPQIKLKVMVRVVESQTVDPFDPFGFFSQPKYRIEEKIITSPAKKIKVVAPGSIKQQPQQAEKPQPKQREPEIDRSMLREL
ncbi:MAG: BatD family protein [Bacteroidaceae bacterium]|nr:BatD family protein [Bacteroidaceae bacterium]MBQ3874795.1 BatD family protein [Bacteroidaceae bacterium]MBQ5351121.1 BatD family protein [Bacteroidaceae bacterium]MBQ5477887.1 BatD family protein [Bacteroidaceae bacterium]MBQ7484329.1 BatD family protein [Bacteroidaceae bacterium]